MVWRCYVRDITSVGARLEFSDAPVLPTDFNLTFDGKTMRPCRLQWRIANEVGVSFESSKKNWSNAPSYNPATQPFAFNCASFAAIKANLVWHI